MKPAHTIFSALRYGLVMMLAAAGICAVVAGFNAWVDPFGMYPTGEQTGALENKPSIYTRMRLYKAFEVERVKPQTIILGSSRTHLGLRCSHDALVKLDGPCYNLAFDGATAKELYYYLIHAQAIRPLKHVILGLDGYHMSPAPAFTRPDFDPLLLYQRDMPRWLKPITAELRLLMSLDTLRESILTLRSQQEPQPRWFAPDGQRLGEVFFRQVQPTFVNEGPRAYFEETDRHEIHDQFAPPQQIPAHARPAVDPAETSRAYIERIVAFCRQHAIDLRIAITPAHAHQTEISTMLWGEDSLENGKRALVQLLAEDAKRHPDQRPILVMDFSGYSQVTTEDLPPIGSRNEMKYYWDSSHFKEVVGDYMLASLFHTDETSIPAGFGAFLTPQTLDATLSEQREARVAYQHKHARELLALKALTTQLPILVYHQIVPELTPDMDSSTAITLARFEAQMHYLHEQGYTTLSMDDVIRYLEGKPFPKKVVAIHFDDGWKSSKQAIPVLARYGLKATFWIIAGAGHNNGSPHMDWDDVLAIENAPNTEVYSHTMTHPWKEVETLLDWVNGPAQGKGLKQARWELVESKRLLEEKLRRPVPYLAWPRGLYNETLIELARQAGYKALLTIDDGFNFPGGDPLRIHRTMVDGSCDMAMFVRMLSDGKFIACATKARP